MSGVGSNPALATCETNYVLLVDVSGGFPGVLPFRSSRYERNNLERDVKLNKKSDEYLQKNKSYGGVKNGVIHSEHAKHAKFINMRLTISVTDMKL